MQERPGGVGCSSSSMFLWFFSCLNTQVKMKFRGLLTLTVGILTFFMMPASPTQSKTWFRPNGWFTEREETIIVSRVLRDDPSKGDMHNREGLSLKRLWTAALDYDLWPVYIL